MAFKNFRFQFTFRVILLILFISLFAWCLTQELYFRSFYVLTVIVIVVIEMIWYVDRFNRDVKVLMLSLTQRDFTTYFPNKGKGKTFDELYHALNRITDLFRKISTEKEIQHRYLEMLVEHVRVGILSYDGDENVVLANAALKKLLQRNVLSSLRSFESIDATLLKNIRGINTGETLLVRVTVGGNLLQLSMYAAEFRLDTHYYKLISMQNIHNELDKHEMEAWQKLIRVLSHEIMNSVAPITSLSATLHGMVRENNKLSSFDEHLHNAMDKGLEAIRIRSEGLHHFTQAYRKLTRVPQPSLKKTNLKDIIQRVQLLLQGQLDQKSITLEVAIVEAEVMIDPDLIEHVLINVLQNAIEAIEENEDRYIGIRTTVLSNGQTSIHIVDNGVGMDAATQEKIFIPFFTTKKNGSGIGLAISKQILQLHYADIKIKSEKGNGTEVTIVL